MTDLSHWDFAERLGGREAAMLIAGRDPSSEESWIGVTPIYDRMENAYRNAGEIIQQIALIGPEGVEVFSFSLTSLHSELMEHAVVAKLYFYYDDFKDGFPDFKNAFFSRSEVVRWLAAIGLKSAYQFVKTFDQNARWHQPVRTARLRYAQGPKSYIASAPQGSVSALRADGRHNPAAFGRQCYRQAAQRRQFTFPHEGAARLWHGNQRQCFRFAQVGGISQLARRRTAIPMPWFRLACASCSHDSGGILGAGALACYGHTLRFYIRPHCPQCPAVTALKLRLVPVTAGAPFG